MFNQDTTDITGSIVEFFNIEISASFLCTNLNAKRIKSSENTKNLFQKNVNLTNKNRFKNPIVTQKIFYLTAIVCKEPNVKTCFP